MFCPTFQFVLSACTRLLLPAVLLTVRLVPTLAQDTAATDRFDAQIAPLLAAHCLGCHGTDDPKGGLNLTTQAGFRKGGDTGSVFNAAQPGNSLLLQRVLQGEMPPEKPLPAEQQKILERWILAGAAWGTDPIDPYQYSSDSRAGFDWWSLQPLQNVSAENPANKHPIDAFVEERLQASGLQRSPQADRRTLIRRLSFDLLGLPPDPADVTAFLADNSPQAWEHLVDRLLASPHYGERWARHWLDVVRFGESNGFEYDEPRDNAWPYRNWLIDAFNQDLPYDRFVRLQIAGDVMHPDDPLAAAASGFLVAGAHNTTLPASEKMRQSMAQDEMEDLVGTVGQTFLGLTVNCARCHDHKFDPISAREYYSFAAALAGVRHGTRDVKMPLSAAQQQQLQQAEQILRDSAQQRDQLVTPVINAILSNRKQGQPAGTRPPQPMAAWEFNSDLRDSIGDLHGTARGNARLSDGSLQLDGAGSFVETPPLPEDIREKTLEAWVRLSTLEQSGGAVVSLQTSDGSIFDAIVFAEREPRRWMAGSNGFTRTIPFNGSDENEAADRFVHVAIVWHQDGSIVGYREGLPYGSACRPGDLQGYAAKNSQLVFGLRHSPAGGNRLLQGSIDRVHFYDRALTADEVAASAFARGAHSIPRAELLAAMTATQRSRLQELEQQQKSATTLQRSLQEQQQSSLYTCISSDPGITHLLKRGDVSQRGDVVPPAGLRAIRGAAADFQLPPNSSDRERRTALAAWITNPDNPLFARVMANRVWHYHFGQGIVPTPGDFGFNGGRPSHPALLDWLATEFRRQGYHLKPLHRLIVTSETWKQASLPRRRLDPSMPTIACSIAAIHNDSMLNHSAMQCWLQPESLIAPWEEEATATCDTSNSKAATSTIHSSKTVQTVGDAPSTGSYPAEVATRCWIPSTARTLPPQRNADRSPQLPCRHSPCSTMTSCSASLTPWLNEPAVKPVMIHPLKSHGSSKTHSDESPNHRNYSKPPNSAANSDCRHGAESCSTATNSFTSAERHSPTPPN